MNLYEINGAIMDAFERAVDPDTGEITDQLAKEEMDNLQMQRDEKLEGILLWIKNLNAEAEALKKEKMAFASRQNAAERKAESLKRYVSGVLCGEKFNTEKVSVSWRKSVSVEFIGNDPLVLPCECLIFRKPDINKEVLKKMLKDGSLATDDAIIVEKNNIQIK